MALFDQATQQSSQPKADAPLLEVGGYPARLLRIVDLGLQPGSTKFPEPKHEMSLVFECLDEFMRDEDGAELHDQPRTFEFTMTYNTDGYMSPKSTIYKVMDALNGFNKPLSALLGTVCSISLIQKATKADATKKYNTISGVAAMREKDAARYTDPLVGEAFLFSLDASATEEMFNKLSTRGGEYSQQAKIKASLSLHDEAPQLAEALKVERRELPPTTNGEPVPEQQAPESTGGAVPETDEADPFE
ncbi:hypothetical protein HOR75_gp33 [Shewanella phage SppYZU05]|uniref:Uncharacterized protein n=1 Tax=Shewanella phage SppYZU05 TaxID=1970795 RepID=A0A1W6JTG2_9CAUD|nr:hypothetical protein HOR75_gp33 [Shewanella phage SppYZU05]ARM70559.1 hypothetical protein SppYZU05_33 [Shewanella phage SppYZU05]